MSEQLEQLYQEARSALKARDYVRAGELLRQILQIDENYKDASRLLAQTVKLRRRRWYNHPVLWIVLGAASIIGLGVWLVPRIPLPSAVVTTSTLQPTYPPAPQSPTVTTIPSETPTLAPTPIPLVWKRVSVGQEFERDTVTVFIIDPKDPEVLYVGMKNAGIYKSIDGGISWRPAHQGLASAYVISLLIDFQDSQILYASTPSGIYKTEDGGDAWVRTSEGTQILMDPQDSSHLYALDNGTIYESTDRGESFRNIHSAGRGCPDQISTLAIDPIDGKALFALGGAECKEGLYLSKDGGKSWTLEENIFLCDDGFGVGLDSQGKYSFASICKTQIAIFIPPPFFDTRYSYRDAGQHMYKESLNGGQRQTLGKPDVGFVRAVAISPDDPDTLYAAGEGIAVSRDGGMTWTKLNNGLGSGKLQMDASTGDTPILYIQPGECDGFYDPDQGWDNRQRLYISTDRGSTWEFAGDDGCSIIKDGNGSTLYRLGISDVPSSESYGWIWRSTDAGRSWKKVFTPYRVITLSADKTRNGFVYIYIQKGSNEPSQQYFSEDYGNNWKRETPRMYIKQCYGSTLQYVDQIRPMAIDPFDGNHVFVIDNKILLESYYGCDSAPAFATAPNARMNSIAFDTQKPNILYAGTDEGAYISFDSGYTWNQINDGLLGATVVYSIVVDKDGNVYAATPYGIFKLEGK
jgi:hypothetical protein